MALVVKDRVRENSTTTGTGSLTLSGAVSGFQTFSSAIGNTNTTYYAIVNGTEWEVGLGTVGAGTLSRDTVLASSTGSKVSLTSGTKDVFCTYPSGKSIYLDSSDNVIGLGTISSGTWNGTAVAVAYGGTGGANASTARTNLGAAASGANSDITSISGLTTSLTVAQGGTGGANASTARTNLGAAASGANSDITSISGLTTALTVAQGGTGGANAATARTNLGVTATGVDTTYAYRANNLSDLANAATARTNLGVTATGVDTTYAYRANNLSDLASASTARTNLGVTATGSDTTYNYRANNLSDVANTTTARSNLGVTATGSDTTYAYRANNLSDLANATTARNNILPSQASASGKFLTSDGTNASWGTPTAAASAGGVIWENGTTISSNYTLTSGTNGLSVGAITIASGVAVTVPSGKRWVVL